MSEPTHYKQKQEKSGDTIAENKHRKEEKQKNDFFFPTKNFREARKKRMGSAYRLHRRTCYTKKEPLRRISEVLKVAATYSPTTQCSTIGDAELNDPVRNGKGWDLRGYRLWVTGYGNTAPEPKPTRLPYGVDVLIECKAFASLTIKLGERRWLPRSHNR